MFSLVTTSLENLKLLLLFYPFVFCYLLAHSRPPPTLALLTLISFQTLFYILVAVAVVIHSALFFTQERLTIQLWPEIKRA